MVVLWKVKGAVEFPELKSDINKIKAREYSAAKRLRDPWWGMLQANKKPEAMLLHPALIGLKPAENKST